MHRDGIVDFQHRIRANIGDDNGTGMLDNIDSAILPFARLKPHPVHTVTHVGTISVTDSIVICEYLA